MKFLTQDDDAVEEGASAASTLPPTKTRKYKPQYGTIVAPDVNSQYHQHIFCVRLDICVDGTNNTVSEVDIVRVPYMVYMHNAYIHSLPQFRRDSSMIHCTVLLEHGLLES